VTGACSLCGARGAVHGHHLTGRAGRGGPYVDADLVLTLCPRCHTGAGGVHQVLRTVGLEWPGVGPLVAHRLRRVAATAELVADTDRPFVLTSGSTRALAALLRETADTIGGTS